MQRSRIVAAEQKEIGAPCSKKSHMNNALSGTSGLTSTTRTKTCHVEAMPRSRATALIFLWHRERLLTYVAWERTSAPPCRSGIC